MTRVRQAVAEIKKVAKKSPVLAGEGAVVFLERLSPALEHVDGSSGSIGGAVRGAIAELVPIIACAPADATTRDAWLERLYAAQVADGFGYMDSLADHWGALCASKAVASAWAERLVAPLRAAWRAPQGKRTYFDGTGNCLSAFVAAERYDEVLALLETAPYSMWHYRQHGMRALAAMGKTDEAIAYAEAGRDSDGHTSRARACEEVLLAAGRVEEAYRRYGVAANAGLSHLAIFRASAKKYTHKSAREIFDDLVARSAGSEGKWFATAKEAGFYDEAIELATRSPCDPRTLTRAAREHAEQRPAFAADAGLLAIHWLLQGHGFEITGADVSEAYDATLAAAERQGRGAEVKQRIRAMFATSQAGGSVNRMLELLLDD